MLTMLIRLQDGFGEPDEPYSADAEGSGSSASPNACSRGARQRQTQNKSVWQNGSGAPPLSAVRWGFPNPSM